MYKKIFMVLLLALMLGLLLGATALANDVPQKPGTKVQVPRIDKGDGWSTWIQTFNVTATDTGVIVFFWGDYSETCPSNDPGPIGHACRVVPAEGTWTLIGGIPAEAKSAILYSVSEEDFTLACDLADEAVIPRFSEKPSENWQKWVEDWQVPSGQIEEGEPLMSTVWRRGPNNFGTKVTSTYNGITEGLEGEGPPYSYFSPYAMKGYFGLDTEITIQNSGRHCTSVDIYYMQQLESDCEWDLIYKVEALAPGEAVRLKVPNSPHLGTPFLGSVYITANEPLGIIVDQTSFEESSMHDSAVLLTSRVEPFPSYGDTRLYADLIFREWGGWSASIQVQNVGQEGKPAYVTVEFFDASGGSILFLGDWVCRHGSKTFYLPVVSNLGLGYVGAAEIESHSYISFPGGTDQNAQPIVAWVDLKRPPSHGDAPQGASYVPHAEHQKLGWETMVFPWVAKRYPVGDQTVTTLLAIRNNSNCVKTQLEVRFTDETGTTVCQLSGHWLEPKYMWLVDLAHIGCLYSGWTGALSVSVVDTEQLCDIDGDGHVDQQPVMPSTVVFTRGPGSFTAGDITTVAEAWGGRRSE